MSGLRVYEFGRFEKPYYAATVAASVAPRDAAQDGNGWRGWCCPFGKGHRSPNAAATHAARLASAEWSKP